MFVVFAGLITFNKNYTKGSMDQQRDFTAMLLLLKRTTELLKPVIDTCLFKLYFRALLGSYFCFHVVFKYLTFIKTYSKFTFLNNKNKTPHTIVHYLVYRTGNSASKISIKLPLIGDHLWVIELRHPPSSVYSIVFCWKRKKKDNREGLC